MSKELEKKSVLPPSSIPVAKGARDENGKKIKPLPPKEYDAAGDIKKYGLKPTEIVKYKDPVTGEDKSIMIDRRGTNDETLALALLDPEMPRERKDSILSMYLFEQGKQGASMLMDLWMYKGTHTKESRQFQSTMRFDFELFLHTFQTFMMDSADRIEQGFEREDSAEQILVEIAKYFRMTSDLLGKRIRAEVEKRERAKGKGIYIGADNKPYSIYEDGDIVEVVSKDKAAADAAKQHDGPAN